MENVSELLSTPVKHLIYVLMGPRLMAFPNILSELPVDPDTLNQWLTQLIEHPIQLYRFLDEHPQRRLGYYHEALWKYFFTTFSQFELIAHNLQVFENNRTIGAFDFLVFDKLTQHYYHIEVATKFYLHHQEGDQIYWLGPNLKDRFDIKANRLLAHQIQLGETNAGTKALQELGIDRYQKIIIVNGMLFSSTEAESLPHFIAPNYHQARYCSLQEFACSPSRSQWQFIDKPNWLAPLALNCMFPSFSQDALIAAAAEFFQDNSSPLMVAELASCHDGEAIEKRRLFITPNDWHYQASLSLSN